MNDFLKKFRVSGGYNSEFTSDLTEIQHLQEWSNVHIDNLVQL